MTLAGGSKGNKYTKVFYNLKGLELKERPKKVSRKAWKVEQ